MSLEEKVDVLSLIQNDSEVKEKLRDIKYAIDYKIWEETTFTESSKSGPVAASDTTKGKMAALFAKTIAKIAIDDMHLNEMNYVNTDDVKIRAQQTIALVFRIIETHGTKDQFVDGYKEIWSSLKTVGQRR